MNIAIKCLDFAISIEVSEYCHNNRTSYPTFTFNIESKIIIIVSGQLQIHVLTNLKLIADILGVGG